MEVYSEKQQITAAIDAAKAKKLTLGLVPTMGALHEGHLQLVIKALEENDLVAVSIFVNPTQFDNPDDLDKYPRTLENDIALLKTVSATKIMVYAPTVDDVYEGNTVSETFDFDGLEHEMEGKFRDGHFDGVGTIVKRLFEIVKPHKAYFGEKDFQQLQIIKKLVEKHHMPLEIVGCKIHREANGLAMSSRNTRLKPEFSIAAPFIYETLKTAKIKFGTKSANEVKEWVEKQFKNHDLLELEYFIISEVETLKPLKRKSNNKAYRAFIAVYADDIRLIDNIALN
ncbi:pantoate--beta-alanine ligase [Algibacter lectus]|uniref:Pantothenate synthetase n=1 Tax=Algibacter lectus TaxID=221126 RepID=A0A090VBF0_9FLAO|nr:pantoate--beta-alanine ligase [Algibacter lectus]MWW24549.1 pantoate--beta-alanine ligase [Algibacter lectus]TDY62568.1 pantoate--beta-alanine ligase [Algibacter lectus]SFC98128.1 pantothenate synthetase [Algibacter lectus]GAL62140.1 pantoate-beta-alanine ligase [Algibacter lectus]GAL81232.1 pantoate-beta-alanine ligase [Algibacter lectus]